MLRTRALEERSIKMSKSGEAYFWIGGPGEEAFNVCLGLQVHKGHGPAFDYLHLHYRNAGVMLAMGMPMIDHIRQLAMRGPTRTRRGRNFVGHYAVPEWNVIPVTSVIEVQFAMAPGTALVQKRHGQKNPAEAEGITVVVGGEAGTAEGDFETLPELEHAAGPGTAGAHAGRPTTSCGISTDLAHGHARRSRSPTGRFPTASAPRRWTATTRSRSGTRSTARCATAAASASRSCSKRWCRRLHGHSSSSGAQRNWNEADPLALFEQKLIDAGAIDTSAVERAEGRGQGGGRRGRRRGDAGTRADARGRASFTYAPSEVDAVYPRITRGCRGRR